MKNGNSGDGNAPGCYCWHLDGMRSAVMKKERSRGLLFSLAFLLLTSVILLLIDENTLSLFLIRSPITFPLWLKKGKCKICYLTGSANVKNFRIRLILI